MSDYATEQRATYRPPQCPKCGSRNIAVHWEETTDTDTPVGVRTWMPIQHTCRSCYPR